ncbi:MAG TPA: 2-phospho-L-lactate guanylyltransferase [Caulobacterales bacterium]|nr:2-phospho-L-lactate guanylyltransferase [Caulobacterales bacterium]
MGVGVIIPFRGLSLGKTRLRASLPDATVNALSKRMLRNVLRSARDALPNAAMIIVTRTQDGLTGCELSGAELVERPLALNEAIEYGREVLSLRGVTRVLALPSDLPLIEPLDVRTLLEAAADVVIAPDDGGMGTNGLVFPAAARNFCCFGRDSARLHAAEAAKRGLSVDFVRTPTLGRDVDTVEHINGAVRVALMDSLTDPGLGAIEERQGDAVV